MGLSYTGNRCLFVTRVSGYSLDPVPPAKITPFMELSSILIFGQTFQVPAKSASSYFHCHGSLDWFGEKHYAIATLAPQDDSLHAREWASHHGPVFLFCRCAAPRDTLVP